MSETLARKRVPSSLQLGSDEFINQRLLLSLERLNERMATAPNNYLVLKAGKFDLDNGAGEPGLDKEFVYGDFRLLCRDKWPPAFMTPPPGAIKQAKRPQSGKTQVAKGIPAKKSG